MEDFNIEFDDEPKKEEKHPADVFLENHRKQMAERSIEQYFKNEKAHLENQTQVAYASMPQGLKEAQQRNGVRDHGLVSGEFEWGDKEQTHVIWVPKENGRWTIADPNNPNEATKDLIRRKFDGKPYYGTTEHPIKPYVNLNDYQNQLIGSLNKDKIEFEVPVGFGKSKGETPAEQPDLLGEFESEFGELKPEIKYKEPTPDSFDGNKLGSTMFHIDEAGNLPKGILSKALEKSEPSNSLLSDIKEQPVAKIYRMPLEGGLHQMKVWVGIDPGKAGAIVAVDEKGSICYKTSIPLIGSDVDAKGLYECLKFIADRYSMCVILEEVHSLHKMAASTNFSMGHTLGIITGIIVASSYKLVMVQPKTWQKEIWVSSEIEYLPKKPEQAKPSIDTKLTSMKAAHRIFPNADFRKSDRAKKPNDGICDAALIAEYGRRKNL